MVLQLPVHILYVYSFWRRGDYTGSNKRTSEDGPSEREHRRASYSGIQRFGFSGVKVYVSLVPQEQEASTYVRRVPI